MASIIDLIWTNCEDLFKGIDVESMFECQKKLLVGPGKVDYPFTVLINSEKITLGVNLERNIMSGEYSQLLIGDMAGPKDALLFDWGYVEDPSE
ncbi:MAG: hypothetical protein AB7V04_01480 [Desulfomonilaceae bacterium]